MSSNEGASHGKGKVEIVNVREKQGYFRKAIPTMPPSLAILLCCINAILPGIGTILSLFAVLYGCRTSCETKKQAVITNILAGGLQLLTCIVLVGWIWSILWGVTFINLATMSDMAQEDSNNA